MDQSDIYHQHHYSDCHRPCNYCSHCHGPSTEDDDTFNVVVRRSRTYHGQNETPSSLFESSGSSTSGIGLVVIGNGDGGGNVDECMDDGNDSRPIQQCAVLLEEEIQQPPYNNSSNSNNNSNNSIDFQMDEFRSRSRRQRINKAKAKAKANAKAKASSLQPLLLMLLLTVLSSLLPLAHAKCSYKYSYSCWGKETSHTLSFDVDSGSSSGYEATTTWSWSPNDATAFQSITDTYSLTDSPIETSDHVYTHSQTSTHVYDSTGSYQVRYTLYFGPGAGGCADKFYEQTGKLIIGDGSCDFEGLTELTLADAPSPTPPPTSDGEEDNGGTNFPLLTPVPTRAPSDVVIVTQSPVTNSPTRSPVKEPTTAPPTDSPTKEPTTAIPTNPPTARPTTKKPTNSPTKEPTANPTTEPPTRSPVEGPQPTYSPTVSIPPTPYPSAAPSTSSPTLPGVTSLPTPKATIPLRTYSVPTVITLHGASTKMYDSVLEKWRQVTSARIKRHSEEYIMREGEPEIQVTVVLQEVTQDLLSDNGGGKLRNLRMLPSDKPLEIEFVSTLEFQSTHTDYNPNEMIASGFTSPANQREYIYSLKAANSDYFESVASMSMIVDGTLVTEEGGVIPPATGGGEDGGGSDFTMYYAIGGAAGGACLCILFLGGGYYLKKKKRRRRSEEEVPPEKGFYNSHGNTNGGGGGGGGGYNANNHSDGSKNLSNFNSNGSNVGTSTNNSNNIGSGATQATSYFGTIEAFDGECDDVSTIGDPYFGDAVPAGMAERDETVADSIISSEGELFVYGVGRGRLNTEASSKMDSTAYTGTTANRMKHLFGDDDTLENMYHNANTEEQQHIPPYDEDDSERITVVAPEGKLGIVVDNPGMDIPVVHAIKETSVLHGRVKVGDLLLSVDERDCRGMSPVAVSKLISSRSDNPTRTLVLLRRTGMN